jgi:putative ABC transport system permease protein
MLRKTVGIARSTWMPVALKVAVGNILEDKSRFIVAVTGITFAAFLMIFQASLLVSFLQAASHIVDASDADLWVTARGVTCFDFSATIERRYEELIQITPGIVSVSRMWMAFAEFRKTDGSHQTVALVGADANAGSELPLPSRGDRAPYIEPYALTIDASTRSILGVTATPMEVELNGHRARVVREVRGFSSFLGSPYVFASFRDTAHYLDVRPEQGMYLLLKLAPGSDPEKTQRVLQARFPYIKVWTKHEFASQSRQYWLSQTGAGGTILISSLLGFLIGLVIVSQTIYAATLENIEEFATLRALGAPRLFIIAIVSSQAVLCGVLGCVIAALATYPLVSLARNFISWVNAYKSIIGTMCIPTLLICALASVTSIRAVFKVDPGRVFRA